MQRQWAGNEFGTFEELQKDQHGWCSVSSGGVADNESRQLPRARNEEPCSLHLIFSVMGHDWRVLTWGVMWFGLCTKDN